MTNDPSLPSEQSTPPHTEERSVGELPGKSDVDALGNIRAVFWIVPLYAFAISLIVIFYAFSNYEAMFSVLAKVLLRPVDSDQISVSRPSIIFPPDLIFPFCSRPQVCVHVRVLGNW